MLLSTTIGILIPFIGTSLGAAMVFVLKDKMSEKRIHSFIFRKILKFF